MKKVEVHLPSAGVGTITELAREHGAFALSEQEATYAGRPGWHQVRMDLPNHRIGEFISAAAAAVSRAEFVLLTSGTLPLRSPIHDLREQVVDVSRRSTLELVLDVHQSVGTWKGMLLYAVVSGLVAAYGVIFGLPFLLTAAMLIAPLGAPAMVCVVGVTMGDLWMIRRGSARFFAALAVLVLAGGALGILYGLSEPTPMMEKLTELSLWSGLLGVVGGAAGAQALVQAERDSLVTATATGFLVAVSLAPPSAVLGLSVALGLWQEAILLGFLLALTFFGILIGGWGALRYFGVRPSDPSAGRGDARRARLLAGTAAAILAALVFWQSGVGAPFQKADIIRTAAETARAEVRASAEYRLLRAEASFAPAERGSETEALLLSVVVDRAPGAGRERRAAREELRTSIRERLEATVAGVRPSVDLSVVP